MSHVVASTVVTLSTGMSILVNLLKKRSLVWWWECYFNFNQPVLINLFVSSGYFPSGSCSLQVSPFPLQLRFYSTWLLVGRDVIETWSWAGLKKKQIYCVNSFQSNLLLNYVGEMGNCCLGLNCVACLVLFLFISFLNNTVFFNKNTAISLLR